MAVMSEAVLYDLVGLADRACGCVDWANDGFAGYSFAYALADPDGPNMFAGYASELVVGAFAYPSRTVLNDEMRAVAALRFYLVCAGVYSVNLVA